MGNADGSAANSNISAVINGLVGDCVNPASIGPATFGTYKDRAIIVYLNIIARMAVPDNVIGDESHSSLTVQVGVISTIL